MAVAEARAAWQRTVNRCLVQEDAKRAPKLACCPSTSPSVKQVDAGPSSRADAQDVPCVGFLPFDRNASCSNLSPNSRWWLQIQPNCGYHRGLLNEQLNSVESEMETSNSDVSSTSKLPDSEDDRAFFYESMDSDSLVNSHFRIPNIDAKNDAGDGKQEMKPLSKQNSEDFSKLEDTRDSCVSAEMGPASCGVSKKVNDPFLDSSPWGEKTEPWWRTADIDELALLVAQRSFDLVENCDLPQPQNTHVKTEPFSDLCYFDHDGIYVPSIDPKYPVGNPYFTIHNQVTFTSLDGNLQSAGIKPLSSDIMTQEAIPNTTIADSDPGKAQLLEALRHSQTRAREAEKAAKQAYAEKEHVVKLVFRQASQLFAYKQWFQLLQLEIKNNQNEPISMLFPVMLPWVPQKTRKLRKNLQKGPRGRRAKRGRPRCDISKYAVVFALGLSLVGAGLLLGWTVGWMLPTF